MDDKELEFTQTKENDVITDINKLMELNVNEFENGKGDE